MTTYNGERFLAASIESILSQSFTDFELIVVDDGSTDSSASIIRSFTARDSRVRGVFLDQNLGIPKAANRGLVCARGEYVARMDSDDLCHRDRLEKQVFYLDKHAEIHVLGCRYRAIDEEGSFCSAASARRIRKPIVLTRGRRRVAKGALLVRYPVLHATIVCRRSTLLSVGGYREFFPMAEDDDLYARVVSMHGRVMDNLPSKLYFYRHYGSSTTQRFTHSLSALLACVIGISSEFRRRGFWDPLEKPPSVDSLGLRFRGVSSVLFLQDMLFFSSSNDTRKNLYSLLRVVVILRRFSLKDLDHISFWNNFYFPWEKQTYFYILFCIQCFRARKFRAAFLYLRRILFFDIFKIFVYYSDVNLRAFRSLIFTDRWYYGLKYLFFAFVCNPFHTVIFFADRLFVRFNRILFF